MTPSVLWGFVRLVSLHLLGPGGSRLAPWSAVRGVHRCQAAAIDCCSCRHHERSRRCLRRQAAPELWNCPLSNEMCNTRGNKGHQTCLSLEPKWLRKCGGGGGRRGGRGRCDCGCWGSDTVVTAMCFSMSLRGSTQSSGPCLCEHLRLCTYVQGPNKLWPRQPSRAFRNSLATEMWHQMSPIERGHDAMKTTSRPQDTEST